jgi:hypothetical protein
VELRERVAQRDGRVSELKVQLAAKGQAYDVLKRKVEAPVRTASGPSPPPSRGSARTTTPGPESSPRGIAGIWG